MDSKTTHLNAEMPGRCHLVPGSRGSMLRAAVSGLLSLCCCMAVTLRAQIPAPRVTASRDSVYLLDSVVVQAEGFVPFSTRTRVLTTLPRELIVSAPVTSVQDLLRYLPGADLRNRGGQGVQADLNILGGTFDQTRLYINGIDFTDPQTGHHSLNIPLLPSQIRRAEVLQSPQALNLVTTRKGGSEEGFSAQVGLTGGSHGTLEAFGQLSYAGFQLGGGYNRSDGYTPNTDYEIGQFFATAGFEPARNHSLFLQAGFQGKKFGAQSFYTPKFPEQYEETALFLSSLSYRYTGGRVKTEVALYQRTHLDEFRLFRHEAPEWYAGHNYHRNELLGGRAALSYDWSSRHVSSLGGEIRYEHILSSNLGLPMETPRGKYKKEIGRVVPSLFVKHVIALPRLRLTGEADWWNKLFLWSLSGAYDPAPGWQITLHSGSSARNPTFTDLFYQSPTQEGNSGLLPEQFILSSLGVGYRPAARPFGAHLRLFHRYGYRIIDWVRRSNEEQWQAANLTQVRSLGVEAGVSYGPLRLEYTGLVVRKEADDLHSLYATDYLQHKVILSGLHRLRRGYSLFWDLSWHKRAGTYLDAENAETPYTPFTLLNLRLQKEFRLSEGRYLRLFALAGNLFNLRYSDIGGIPQPGFTFKAGLTFSFAK